MRPKTRIESDIVRLTESYGNREVENDDSLYCLLSGDWNRSQEEPPIPKSQRT